MRMRIKTHKFPFTQENTVDRVLHLLGWESGMSFLNQSRGEKKQIPDNFRHSIKNCSY